MAQQNINAGDTGAEARAKINGNATELYGALESIEAQLAERISGQATINITGIGGHFEWLQSVQALGVIPTHMILCNLAPATDEDENDPEMLNVLAMSAQAGTDEIEFTLAFSQLTSGPVRLNWSAF